MGAAIERWKDAPVKKLRVGCVGTGYITQWIHIPSLVSLDHCELVALAELRPKLGQGVQQRWGVPKLYPDHRVLAADEEVDAAVVVGHYAMQAEVAADMLAAGKHVFMEKPMALSVAQAERILAAADAGGARLMVGYMKRYDGGNVLAHEAIARFRRTGELGAVTYVRNHGFCGTNWTAGADLWGVETDEPRPEPPPLGECVPDWLPAEQYPPYLSYLQQYTHNVNLVRYLLDAGDDARVRFVDVGEANRGLVVLEVAGVRAVIESGHVDFHGWEEHTQVYFEKGWVKVTSPPLMLRNMPAAVEIYRADGGGAERCEPFPQTGWTWSYREEMRHFVDGVLSGERFRSSGEDTLTDVRLFEEVFRMRLEKKAGR